MLHWDKRLPAKGTARSKSSQRIHRTDPCFRVGGISCEGILMPNRLCNVNRKKPKILLGLLDNQFSDNWCAMRAFFPFAARNASVLSQRFANIFQGQRDTPKTLRHTHPPSADGYPPAGSGPEPRLCGGATRSKAARFSTRRQAAEGCPSGRAIVSGLTIHHTSANDAVPHVYKSSSERLNGRLGCGIGTRASCLR